MTAMIGRNQRDEVLVVNLLFAVSQLDETMVDFRQFRGSKRVAKLGITRLQRMASRVLAQNNQRARSPDGFGRHDLVAERVRQHSVLVNSGFMGKGVCANNRLVGLRTETNCPREFAARLAQK